MCQQKIKKIEAFLKKDIIRSLVICSILFALFIHILFKIKTGPECLKAEWEAGDILTYASTVALGLLALWQNKRFKEENDISQERLEKLTEQANSLTVINKIIEIESDKTKRLRSSIENFEHACDLANIINLFVLKEPNEQEKMDMMLSAYAAKENIKKCRTALFSELCIVNTEKAKNLNSFARIALEYSQASAKTIDMMSDSRNLMNKPDFKPVKGGRTETQEQAVLVYQLQQEFARERDSLLNKRDALLEKIVFGNHTVDSIRQLLNQETVSKKSIEKES